MGCFNLTCPISGLTIHRGDRVVFTLLKPNKSTIPTGLNIYPDDEYRTYLLPIRGTYNEYGSLEHIDEDVSARINRGIIDKMKSEPDRVVRLGADEYMYGGVDNCPRLSEGRNEVVQKAHIVFGQRFSPSPGDPFDVDFYRAASMAQLYTEGGVFGYPRACYASIVAEEAYDGIVKAAYGEALDSVIAEVHGDLELLRAYCSENAHLWASRPEGVQSDEDQMKRMDAYNALFQFTLPPTVRTQTHVLYSQYYRWSPIARELMERWPIGADAPLWLELRDVMTRMYLFEKSMFTYGLRYGLTSIGGQCHSEDRALDNLRWAKAKVDMHEAQLQRIRDSF